MERAHPGQPRTALLAALDIGTVSTRLIAARPLANGGFDVLERQARITDLGEGVDARGTLARAAVGRTLAAVRDYLASARQHAARAALPLAVAVTTTSAARDAENSDDLLEPLRDLGLDPQVIPGSVEARLALLGVVGDFAGQSVAVADVGGGSTELTVGGRTQTGELLVRRCASYDVGCRRLTERFFSDGGPATPSAQGRARACVADALRPFFGREASLPDGPPPTLVCVGGTATSLVSVANALVPYDPSFVHLHRMAHARVHEQAQALLGMSSAERAALPGLQPKRAAVIAAGALILDVLMDLGGWQMYAASESDSLVGLLTCMRARLANEAPPLAWTPRLALIG